MKKKELKVYGSKSADEVAKEIRERRVRLNELKFVLAAGKTANVKEIRAVKKEIAQLLTIENAGKKRS